MDSGTAARRQPTAYVFKSQGLVGEGWFCCSKVWISGSCLVLSLGVYQVSSS